jgi:peptide/nickel transport system permease protein
LRTILLPALTLGLVQIGFIARMARASMLDVLSQDFVRTADAKGLSRFDIVVRHGLPNALIPILTVIGIVTGALLGGTVIIEQVFSIPGFGTWPFSSLLSIALSMPDRSATSAKLS